VKLNVTFKDIIMIKICENVKDFSARRLLQESSNKLKENRKRGTLNNFLRKLQTSGSTQRTAGSGKLFYDLCVALSGNVKT